MESISYFLNEVLNRKFSLKARKREMERVGRRTCQGFPEWSDLWGVKMEPIDDISIEELRELLDEYSNETYLYSKIISAERRRKRRN